jgi:hypothetical protein
VHPEGRRSGRGRIKAQCASTTATYASKCAPVHLRSRAARRRCNLHGFQGLGGSNVIAVVDPQKAKAPLEPPGLGDREAELHTKDSL